MDGYRQTLLGRALADALQDIEKELSGDNSDANTAVLEMDGDLLFSLFDEAMQLELLDKRCKDQEKPIKTFTHDSLELTGQVTAFNRFMDDWSVLLAWSRTSRGLRSSKTTRDFSWNGSMLSSTIKNSVRKAAVASTLTRGMAAAASSTKEVEEIGGFGQMTQPKLQLFGLHARYANALYSVAAKQNQLESVEKELLTIEETIAKEPNFASFLHDPTIARASKKEDIAKVMEKAKFSKPVAGLFEVLADNGRLPDAAGVISAFKKLMGAYRGEVQAKVTSADPLTKTQLDQVKKALGARVEKNEKLLLETVVDPEILGGLKVQIGNYFIDLSLATKIDKINTLLANSSQQ
ncbi:hypothetical protein PC116_g17615 [Phytophthora cactorum]|uniref:Uncharacterized protein n=2 Tax=Phytophthora cactorum TaxID=29920 RepID=A0A8T1FQ28_9STRA|nr:hypothetical protein PC112_g15392 [Phytophthora cactorum]KAG2851656.1 hypothetical protein PC113_g15720 [Phytophthora cactorum]KAG2890868.1 hypothetical protein PC114_g17261 [Phytophthora cactorum]KAG2972552.1 hypothetical protein PC118_g15628 [Phytophthora cactorum]KAG3001730.1 hypothetical protein PC119_g16617 [Phytophthora cactorum]